MTAAHQIDIQNVSGTRLPKLTEIRRIVNLALADCEKPVELSVRFVDLPEMIALNGAYRGKEGPTNVLSFEAEDLPFLKRRCLGDVIISPDVLIQEAQAQHKTFEAHFAHLLLHGVLHLLGYDHIVPEDAAEMEAREIALLAQLGLANPYESLV